MTTWFHDVLVRFGYDLFEHEHPWDGEWIDDAFEAAALDLRSTGAKLVRALERIDTSDAEAGPLTVDLPVAYLGRILDDLAIVIPNCYGQEGRSLRRGDLDALGFTPPVDLTFPTTTPELYMVVDASTTPTLPKALARARAESRAVTVASVDALDAALVDLCGWFDDLLVTLQREIAKRAEDGDDVLARWSDADWSVIGRATPTLERRLPRCR